MFEGPTKNFCVEMKELTHKDFQQKHHALKLAWTNLKTYAPYLISITGHALDPSGTFIRYQVKLEEFDENSGQYIPKTKGMRYKEFIALHQKLQRKCLPETRGCIPSLPGKRLFLSNFDEAFLTQRQKQLELFLKTVVALDPLRVATDLPAYFASNSPGIQ